MAAEAEVLDELHRLRARVPQLTGALAASVDGLVIAQDTPGVEPEGLAALTAAALGVAVRLTDATGQGDLRELLVRGTNGYVATYSAGSSAVLTLLAQDRVNVGRLHLEGRRAGTRIGELVDAATARATPPPRTAVGKVQSRATSTTTDKSALPTRPAKPTRARTARTTQAARTAQTAQTAQTNGRTTNRTTTNTTTTNES
ncbi:roadblock/LC7 domain-containing protein [Streptomyces yerevanensis]|uniref:roadblock/LC7 domain-containing protein n=1 Tax=Streptomyces yerevanensis TaxID=66378 RepID=UPI000526341F|nr:roadblock/LC7 domain-containing protein [Streptomyces yerevanensis]